MPGELSTADVLPNDIEDEASEESKAKSKKGKHNDGAADLDKVTDFVEEQEISSQDIQKTMKLVSERRMGEAAKKAAHEKEISRVKVTQEDVDLIAHEMEVPKSVAERKLKEHGGDVVAALKELTKNLSEFDAAGVSMIISILLLLVVAFFVYCIGGYEDSERNESPRDDQGRSCDDEDNDEEEDDREPLKQKPRKKGQSQDKKGKKSGDNSPDNDSLEESYAPPKGVKKRNPKRTPNRKFNKRNSIGPIRSSKRKHPGRKRIGAI